MVISMINPILIKLTENDKRIIFVILALIILVLIIAAYIGFLITKIMKYQGKKINNYVTDVIVTGVITNEKDFKQYAKKKNWWLFYHQARIPALVVLIGVIFYIIASSITGYKDPFNKDTGFASLLFVWDFSVVFSVPEEGVGLLIRWPELVNTPHFTSEAWISYIFVPIILVGGIWYLVTVQAFIARQLQIMKLSQKIFNEQIERYVANQNVQNGTYSQNDYNAAEENMGDIINKNGSK